MNESKYDLLNKTIRTTLATCGRFPSHLRYSAFRESLIDEGVNLGMKLLRHSDDAIVTGAKSIARKLIHREKYEYRWWDTDETGKNIRMSKATFRITHPFDDRHNLTANVPADNRGGRIETTALNETEARMVERLDRLDLYFTIAQIVGADIRFMLDYVERKRGGSPIPASCRHRFRVLKKKVLQLLPHETIRKTVIRLRGN